MAFLRRFLLRLAAKLFLDVLGRLIMEASGLCLYCGFVAYG